MARQRFIGGAAVPESPKPPPRTYDASGVLPGQDEIDYRRSRVVILWLRRMTQCDIAKVLGVDQATISRDLAVIRKQWRTKNSTPASFNPDEELAETLALLRDAEASALRDYDLCDTLTHPNARARFLLAAVSIRQQRINLLQDLNLFDDVVGTSKRTQRVSSADKIRATLREEGLLDPREGLVYERTNH